MTVFIVSPPWNPRAEPDVEHRAFMDSLCPYDVMSSLDLGVKADTLDWIADLKRLVDVIHSEKGYALINYNSGVVHDLSLIHI